MSRIALLAKKVGMTQLFTEEGAVVPVTLLEAGPCTVIQKKQEKTDGYNAIQIGFLDKKENRVNKPELGHFKKNNVSPKQYVREVRVDNIDDFEVGQEIKSDIFEGQAFVDIVGTSIGKGFQGVVKRHNFSGLKNSHGARWKRHMGSAGAGTYPANIIKGKKMPGRTGGTRTTTQSLKVIMVKPDENLIFVKGSVPGKTNNILMIRQAVKKPNK